jgi:signal transduction histidine kinase
VADINTLLQRNRDIIQRSRRQAADLAHALKTPSAILRNELQALSEKSHDLDRALDALGRMDAQLGRSLARVRMANSGESTFARTDLTNSVNRLSRLFGAMAKRDGKHLTTVCEPDLEIRVDAQDIEEVMGNLLDNALKWGRHDIALTVRQGPEGITLTVEDDGPGIPERDRTEAVLSGGRLDTSKPGTGLGLAIAIDLLQVYDASLALAQSQSLGGLSVQVMLPAGLVRS